MNGGYYTPKNHIGRNFLVGTFLVGMGLFGLEKISPVRETSCTTFIGYNNQSDGEQKVQFDGGTYETGIGFNPDKLESGRKYRLQLKRYLAGLGGERIIGTLECDGEVRERINNPIVE